MSALTRAHKEQERARRDDVLREAGLLDGPEPVDAMLGRVAASAADEATAAIEALTAEVRRWRTEDAASWERMTAVLKAIADRLPPA
jgi:hypothetical protein